jgi:small GTP-binding protein
MSNNTAYEGFEEDGFFNRVEAKFSETFPDLSKSLNIAIVGKVSSGKSSLINALLKLGRRKAMEIAKVGAVSGVTKDLTILRLDDRVHLIDSPGLDDIRAANSKVTTDFLKHIDVGIFVVTGSSDASQAKNLRDLQANCDKVFVVLNKIDEWDDLGGDVLQEIIQQWEQDLNIKPIYPVCTKGYDPRSKMPNLDIRGVSVLRNDLESFLETQGKDLLLARHVAEKQSYAVKIIATALVAVTGAVFFPGSAGIIAAAQGVAIASLYYLHTGEILSAQSALTILTTTLAENAGSSLFLVIASFLPPTGVIEVVEAAIAITITLALLSSIHYLLADGSKLNLEKELSAKFKTYRSQARKVVKDLALTDVRELSSWITIVSKFLKDNK